MRTASLPPFIGWFVEAVTINVLVSNKVEVPLTEMKCLVIGSYVFPIREVFKKCKSGVFNHLGGGGGVYTQRKYTLFGGKTMVKKI